MFITQNITKYIKNSKRVKESCVWCTSVIPSLRVQGHHRESEASLNPPFTLKKERKAPTTELYLLLYFLIWKITTGIFMSLVFHIILLTKNYCFTS